MTTVEGLKEAIVRLTEVIATLNTARTKGYEVPVGQYPMRGADNFAFGTPQNNAQRIDEIQEGYRREISDIRHNQRTGSEMFLGELGSLLSWGGLSFRRVAGHAFRVYQKVQQARLSREEELARRDIWERRQQEKKMRGMGSGGGTGESIPPDDGLGGSREMTDGQAEEMDYQEGMSPEEIMAGTTQARPSPKSGTKPASMSAGAGVAAAVVAVVAAFIMVNKAALEAADSVGKMAKEMGKVSPTMALIAQQREIREIQREQRKGELIAPGANKFLNEEAKFKDFQMSLEVMYEDIKNGFFTGALKKLNRIVELVESLTGKEDIPPAETAITIAEDFAKNRR